MRRYFHPTSDDADDPRLTDPAALAEQHPADVADAIELLDPEEAAQVLQSLPPDDAAEALAEMERAAALEYVEELEPSVAASALARMSPDDAVDILAEMPADHRDDILDSLNAEDRKQLEELMAYAPETAAGIMSPEVTALSADLTVAEAIAALRKIADESEQIYYTYVVDEQRRLVGVLSLRDLLLAASGTRLRDIMIDKITSVPAEMDREDVARTLSKYGYFALPVVDPQNRLLGIVTVDDVVDVIQDEATEDMQRMVGAGGDERVDSPLPLVLRRRLPWLVVNLGTAFLAASVIGMFEGALAKLTALAVLMPVVAGQAGNTGAQSMAVVIRAIATGEMHATTILALLLREIWIGFTTGLAVALFGVAYVWFVWHDAELAMILGLGLVGSMTIATISGAAVPWIMKRFGFDPAQSSSIILTTITDISGFGIFLAMLGTWVIAMRG